MGKRKHNEKSENLNDDFCEFLIELAEYEKNINKNTYKYRAYKKAAETLANYPKRITSGEEAKKLRGIGKKIAEKIDEFLATGKVKKLEDVREDERCQVITLLTRISGVGPSKASELYEIGVRDIQDLYKHLDKLTHHQKIGLKYYPELEMRIPREEVAKIEKILLSEIEKVDKKYMATVCGSYRRGKSSCGDIDCLLTHANYLSNWKSKDEQEQLLRDVILQLENCNLIKETMAMGDLKFMGICKLSHNSPSRRLDIRLVPHDQYFCGLLYFTGSDLFNQKMRQHANDMGFTLNEYCLRPLGNDGKPGKPLQITSEKDVFELIDFPYKDPSERDI